MSHYEHKQTVSLHVVLDNRTKTTGIIICEQAKVLDVRQRKAEFIEKAPEDIIFEVIDIISGFTEIEEIRD